MSTRALNYCFGFSFQYSLASQQNKHHDLRLCFDAPQMSAAAAPRGKSMAAFFSRRRFFCPEYARSSAVDLVSVVVVVGVSLFASALSPPPMSLRCDVYVDKSSRRDIMISHDFSCLSYLTRVSNFPGERLLLSGWLFDCFGFSRPCPELEFRFIWFQTTVLRGNRARMTGENDVRYSLTSPPLPPPPCHD